MAHPMRGTAAGMMSDKLHRMTRDYGAADPEANIAGNTDKYTQNGPQEAAGFGDNGSAPKARPDRSSRKNKTVLANPLPTYANGGVVKRAAGGRTKHKPSTHVNVIVAPQGGSAGGPPPPVVGGPPGLPPGGPPPMAKPPMMPPGAMGAPGGMPPGPMPPAGGMPGLRAGGGRTYAKGGAVEDETKKTLNEEGLTRRADGGDVWAPSDKEQRDGRTQPRRARGGKVGHYDAGAGSGEGRLEKIKNYGARAHEKPQAV